MFRLMFSFQFMQRFRADPATQNVISVGVLSFEPGSVIANIVATFPENQAPPQEDLSRVITSSNSLSDGNTTILINTTSVTVEGIVIVTNCTSLQNFSYSTVHSLRN